MLIFSKTQFLTDYDKLLQKKKTNMLYINQCCFLFLLLRVKSNEF